MKFTVERATWMRGAGTSTLLSTGGCRCCLGFVAKQCGISDAYLLRKATPPSLSKENRKLLPQWLFTEDSFFSSEDGLNAMEINDSYVYSDAEREEKLKEIFTKHGDEIEFI